MKLRTIGLRNVYLYIIGYGVPVLVIIGMMSASFLGQEVTMTFIHVSINIFFPKMYLRRDSECRMVACFLATEAMVAMVLPAITVAVVNTVLTLKMVWTVHQHRKKRNG